MVPGLVAETLGRSRLIHDLPADRTKRGQFEPVIGRIVAANVAERHHGADRDDNVRGRLVEIVQPVARKQGDGLATSSNRRALGNRVDRSTLALSP